MTSAQIDTIQALEADNNRLKGEIKMKEELIPGMEKMIAYLNKIQQENKQLKEENKELKEENKILKDATDTYEDLLAGEKGLIDENKELKNEVKLLQDQLEDDDDDKICDLLECDHDGRYDAIRELKDEYDELKDENKTIKFLYDKEKNWREVAEKMVDSVRMELCCRDKAGEDVSWDDIADCVDYDSHQEEYEKQYDEEYGELTDK
jgi:chromosome segregation ATPase